MQTWGAQTGAPRRKATDIRSDESSSRVPSDEQGRACRNAPEWGAAAAIRRALLAWSGAADNTFFSWIHQRFVPVLLRSGKRHLNVWRVRSALPIINGSREQRIASAGFEM